MHLLRRTHREVLRDKSGISASLPEAMAGVALKTIIIAAVGGVIATGFAFWAVSTASADTSSGFQNANVAFEKAVHEADVVIGIEDSRVGLLHDLPDNKCEVQTWQGISRDGGIGLQVDIKTVDGVCTPTTPLHEAGSAKDSKELLFNIDAPVFTYANLGGRELTFDTAGASTLTTGTKPDGTKKSNWDDVRPYKVTMTLQSLSEDTAAAAKKSVSTGYTNVVAVTAAADSLRYVPTPSTDPIPGPVKITSVVRSDTLGAEYVGVREGAAVTFTGAICEARPTKVTVAYTQQSPLVAPVVSTTVNATLTGAATTVHLGSVPNGSTGEVEVAAICIDEGVIAKDSIGYTQSIPATQLKVTQNAAGPHHHDLSWVKVSSLPTSFNIQWRIGSTGFSNNTDKLTYTAVNEAGTTFGRDVTYTVIAVIDRNVSPGASATIRNDVPAPAPANPVASGTGVSWAAVACVPDTHAEYTVRYYQQTGKDTTVSWSAQTPWSTERTLKDVTTPEYGRTVFEVMAACVATKTGGVSNTVRSPHDAFYVPEALTVSVTRSTTAGTAFEGLREGAQVWMTGGRCWNGTRSTYVTIWNPQLPAGQATPGGGTTQSPTTATTTLHVAGVKNGASGKFVTTASCDGVKTSTNTATTDYSQPLPKPVLTVAQGASAKQHVVSWGAVSSLPTTFQISKKALAGTENAKPATTTALTQTLTYSEAVTYGNKSDYVVTASVGNESALSAEKSITTPWPATPKAKSIAYARTGAGSLYQAGNITWSYDGSCPAATTLQGRLLENRTGQEDGTISNTVMKTDGWSTSPTTYAWGPSYSFEGYAYGVGVDTRCVSNATGIESPTAKAQSGDFVTAIRTPAAPVWDAYNMREWIRGTNWTYSTCFAGGCPSLVVDYKTYCSAGTKVNWSNFTSTDWNPASYNHPFGWQDNWHLASGTRNVTYHSAKYTCGTKWTSSAQSPVGASKVVQVRTG